MRERTRPMWPAAAVVTVLVVLAGCSALVPGAAEPTPTETVTPVPVESPSPTATETPRPDTFGWLTTAGRLDTDRLFDEHTAYLSKRSFTLNWTRDAVGGDGPVAHSYSRRIAVENNSTFSRRETGTAYDGAVWTYVDPSGRYRKTMAADGTNQTMATRGTPTSARSRFALLGGSIADIVFVSDGARVSFTERDGTEYALLFSTTPPDYLRALYGEYTIENFSSTVWVHEDRYIRTVHYEFTLVNAEERIDIEERYSYVAVGETEVEKPDWAAALAVNATGTPSGPAGNETATASLTPTPTPTSGDPTPASE